MQVRKLSFFVLIAAGAALALTLILPAGTYDDQLVRIQAHEHLAHINPSILNEPTDIQALLLDYSADETLLLKAWIALSKYPNSMRQLMRVYGTEPVFKQILLTHGEAIVPVVQYFRAHTFRSLSIKAAVGTGLASVTRSIADLYDKRPWKNGPATAPAVVAAVNFDDPDQRGWYAVNEIRSDGHDFLGQFVFNAKHEISWVQPDRGTKWIASILTGGIRNLESTKRRGEPIQVSDYFFAGLDVLPFVGLAKGLRVLKAASTAGKEVRLSQRVSLLAPKLLDNGLVRLAGKYGAFVGTGYLVLAHPQLFNSMLAGVANLLGINPFLLQLLVWSFLIFIALYPFVWILNFAAKIVLSLSDWLSVIRNGKQAVI